LIIGHRTDLSYPHKINSSDPTWISHFEDLAEEFGQIHGKYGIDYMIFRTKYTRFMSYLCTFHGPLFHIGVPQLSSHLISSSPQPHRSLPPFLIRRTIWENWLVAQYLQDRQSVVVDASKAILAVHLQSVLPLSFFPFSLFLLKILR